MALIKGHKKFLDVIIRDQQFDFCTPGNYKGTNLILSFSYLLLSIV